MIYSNCYHCGRPGHLRAACPQRAASRRSAVPGRPPAEAGAAKREKNPAFTRRPESEISSQPNAWANYIRQTAGFRVACEHGRQYEASYPEWGQPYWRPAGADVFSSSFRRVSGYHPVHECRLRALAAEQAAGSKAERLAWE